MKEQGYAEEIDLTNFLEFLRRRKIAVAVTTLLFACAGYLTALIRDELYTASVIIEIPAARVIPAGGTAQDSEESRAMRAKGAAGRINERVFGGRAGEVIALLDAKAEVVPFTELVRVSSKKFGGEDRAEMERLLSELVFELAALDAPRIEAETRWVERQIASLRETGPGMPRDEFVPAEPQFPGRSIHDLEFFKTRLKPVRAVRGPYSREVPRLAGVALAASVISGFFFGLLAGFGRDKFSGRRKHSGK